MAKGPEFTGEAREVSKHKQIDSIRFESMEAVDARNEAEQREQRELSPIDANRESGEAREDSVRSELVFENPGSNIQNECCLRDDDGKVVKDSQTGEARRIDFAVIKDGVVEKLVEVTSETADKTAQMAKEARIREAGGNYIKDRETGEFVHIQDNVKTEIRRRA